jgi:hypothetical protein
MAINPFDAPATTPTNPFDAPVANSTPQVVAPKVAAPNPFDQHAIRPVPTEFDSTPLGFISNYFQAVPENAANILKGLGQGVARDAVSVVNSLEEAVNRTVQYAKGDKTAFHKDLPQYNDIPVSKGFEWLLGDQNLGDLSTQVADLEQTIKYNGFAKKIGADKIALPLAFGTVIGNESLNFLGAEGSEGKQAFDAAVSHIAKETDPQKIFDLLIHNGFNDVLSGEAAPHLANTVDHTEVSNTLKTMEVMQSVLDKTASKENQAANERVVEDISKASGFGGTFQNGNVHSVRALNIYDLLTEHGVPDNVASPLSEKLWNVHDPVQIRQALQEAGAMKGQTMSDLAKQTEGQARLFGDQPSTQDTAKKLVEETQQKFPETKTTLASDMMPKDVASAAADYKSKFVDAPNKDGGLVEISGDEIKKLNGADYAPEKSNQYSAAAYDMVKEEIANGPKKDIAILGGGAGSGKSEIIAKALKEEGFNGLLYDTTLSDYKGTKALIDEANKAGKDIQIHAIVTDPEVARFHTLMREIATGREVTDEAFARTHAGFVDTLIKLLENGDIAPEQVHLTDARGNELKKAEDALATLKNSRYTTDEITSKYGRQTIEEKYKEELRQQRASPETRQRALPESTQGDGKAKVSVGEGTQAQVPQESGPKQIKDLLPKPEEIAAHVRANGESIPVDRTPAHALNDLASGADGKSWQSITKGYMYNWSPNKRAHWFDRLATPEFVLEKLGLGKGAEMLQDAKENAQKTIAKEFDTISSWIDRVKGQVKDGSPHSYGETSTLIFDWLDGRERDVAKYMTDEEVAVAREIRDYLKGWAGRLKLPEESQIGKYITHIFDRSVAQKGENQFLDPELAAIMSENVAKSVYDPFLQQRLGARDYVHDVWRALDAYVKRGARKEAIDPALEYLSDEAKNLDNLTYGYVKDLTHKVNMRPTETEQAFDSFITQTPIGHYFTDRPTAYLSKKMRQIWYRGTLGLNLGSGLRNLTQGANTYAKLGEKYTIVGYSKLMWRIASRDLQELYDHGVLADGLVQDRQRGVMKKSLEAIDKTLFANYTLTELINRGAAYYGAKSMAIGKGLSEEEAVKFAKRMVRETQFSFSSVDTPTFLNDDIKKTLFQLQNYNVKQLEFLGRMALQKDIAGLVRFSAASFFMLYTIGRAFGMTASQLVPTIGIGASPLTSTALAMAGLMSGNQQTHDAAVKQLQRNFFSLIPAGAQLRKTIQGAHDLARGGEFTPTGKFKFRVGPEDAAQALLFGPSALPQAQKYYSSVGKQKQQQGNAFDQ